MTKSKRPAVNFEDLETLRDELRLQAHLFKADVETQWETLEADWQKLKEARPTLKNASRNAAEDIDAAAKQLVHSLYDGYQKIRNALPRFE